MLTEDYELSLALRVNGYDTMAPRTCKAQTDLMPTTRMLWAQRAALVSRGVREPARPRLQPGIRSDIGWLAFSLWAAASRWLFLLALAVTVITVGHMSFSPWLLALFVFASTMRIVQVRELGLKYMVMARADGRGALLRLLSRGRPLALGVSRLLREKRRKLVTAIKDTRMYPNAPTLFAFTIILAVAAISTIGFSAVWGIFAVTLFVTTAVAIHRSIPRAER